MLFVTDFADAAVIAPVTVTIACLLVILGWPRGALGWTLGVSSALAAVLIGKLVLFTCAHGPSLLRSPSGHTAAAAVVFGGLLALPATQLQALSRTQAGWSSLALALLFGGVAGGAIGASRLLLGVHTLNDVLAGALCGVLGLWLMLVLAGPMPPRLVRRQPLTALLGSLLLASFMLLLHGERLPLEPLLHQLSARLRITC